jgi:hypothetical protein
LPEHRKRVVLDAGQDDTDQGCIHDDIMPPWLVVRQPKSYVGAPTCYFAAYPPGPHPGDMADHGSEHRVSDRDSTCSCPWHVDANDS